MGKIIIVSLLVFLTANSQGQAIYPSSACEHLLPKTCEDENDHDSKYSEKGAEYICEGKASDAACEKVNSARYAIVRGRAETITICKWVSQTNTAKLSPKIISDIKRCEAGNSNSPTAGAGAVLDDLGGGNKGN